MMSVLFKVLLEMNPLAMATLLLNVVLFGWILITVACRFDKMTKKTSARVAWQYGSLFAGSASAFMFQFAPALREYSVTAALAGVTVFLALSAKRWRHGVPEGLRS